MSLAPSFTVTYVSEESRRVLSIDCVTHNNECTEESRRDLSIDRVTHNNECTHFVVLSFPFFSEPRLTGRDPGGIHYGRIVRPNRFSWFQHYR
jgi:hypothetical protein